MLRWICVATIALLLAGCGGSLWPFGGEKSAELSRVPANATEYRCNNDRRFYVRWLDNGAAAWVIYPEREFRLDKADAERRYTNRGAILEINEANEVSLRDGATVAFTGCKAAGAQG